MPGIEILSHCAACATVRSAGPGTRSTGGDVKEPCKPALPLCKLIVPLLFDLRAPIPLAILVGIATIEIDGDFVDTIGDPYIGV